MRNIEEQVLTKISRERGESNNPVFLEKIQTVWNRLKPKLRDFSDVYPKPEIEADLKEIENLKEKFEFKGETAIVGETVIMEGIYELQWLAEDVEVFPASEYDDIKYGIDFILRFDAEKPLYLGVDVTTSTDESIIESKRKKILNFLNQGKLGYLKYFEDPVNNIKGKIELPKIAIIFDSEAALKMQDLMLKIKNKEKLNEEEQKELNRIKEIIERRVINELQNIIENINERLKQTRNKNKYQKYLNEYQKILDKLEKK